MGLILSVYSRYSGADIVSAQQIQWGCYYQCTGGTVGLRLSMFSKYFGADIVSVQQVQWD